ncbi:MAG TPA: sensor histidine kinase N-terminal domain-containing protein, partial [Casimicrobiaceae bacterium]|nr:sensor histidine kinase N-terminal domain-containing protein [Casimicrobiaceae bacterium]
MSVRKCPVAGTAKMGPGTRTLRSQLLRWLLVPLSLLFIVDAIGSYFLARHLSNDVYDGELMEIARELNLHVKVADAKPKFDLEADAERTLLLDQYDDVFYAVRAADGSLLAGDVELSPGHSSAAPQAYDGIAHGQSVRVAQIRANHGNAPFTIQVAETLVKRHMLANEMLIGVILPQLLLIAIAGGVLWAGVARGLAPLRALQQAVAARSHL